MKKGGLGVSVRRCLWEGEAEGRARWCGRERKEVTEWMLREERLKEEELQKI